MDCTILVAKTKALISFAVTAKLNFAFVFAYAYCWFCHAAAILHQLVNMYIPSEEQKGKSSLFEVLFQGICLIYLASRQEKKHQCCVSIKTSV